MKSRKFFLVFCLVSILALTLMAFSPMPQAQLQDFEFTPELLSGVVGAIFTLLFTYFPMLNTEYGKLKTEYKSFIMLGLLAASSLVIYFGQCSLGFWDAHLTCGQAGLWQVVSVLYYAVLGNVGTYVILPQPKAVLRAKNSR